MTTITKTTTPAQPRPATDSTVTTFLRLIGVELRKSADTLAGRWLLIIIAAITAGAVAVFFGMAKAADDRTFGPMLLITGIPQSLLIPVLGVLLVTGEWSQRTGLITFTLTPARSRVVIAKITAALILSLTAILVAIACAALATVLGGADDPWDVTWRMVGLATLSQVVAMSQGVAFGLLIMNSAGAIASYYVLPAGITALMSWPRLADVAPWVDLNRAMPDPLTDAVSDNQWARFLVAFALWVLLPMVIGVFRTLRREVK